MGSDTGIAYWVLGVFHVSAPPLLRLLSPVDVYLSCGLCLNIDAPWCPTLHYNCCPLNSIPPPFLTPDKSHWLPTAEAADFHLYMLGSLVEQAPVQRLRLGSWAGHLLLIHFVYGDEKGKPSHPTGRPWS